jgi:L-amino acid N-acyltransferase YncA
MLEVREATPADVSAIAEINVRGWQVAFRHLFPDEFLNAMDPEEREPLIEEMVRRGHPHHVAVAVEEDRVVGYVMLGPPLTEDLDASRIHEVYSLYIDPDRIGTGLGRNLMDHALEYLRAGGWDYAVLWSLRDVERSASTRWRGGSSTAPRRSKRSRRRTLWWRSDTESISTDVQHPPPRRLQIG